MGGLGRGSMKIESLDTAVWDDLVARPAGARGFVAAELLEVDGDKGKIYLFVARDKSLHCAIKLGREKLRGKTERPVAGLEFSERRLAIRGAARAGFIDIRCGTAYKEIFTWFVKEVGRHHLQEGLPPRAAVAAGLKAGRRFWQIPGEVVMDTQRQLGLWGEIRCLRELLKAGVSSAVSAWTGPLGEDYDFCFTKVLIEAKATLLPRHQHEISSLDQLDPPAGSTLFVWSIRAALGAGGTSVWEEAVRAAADLSKAPEARELFLDKAARARLRPDHENAYSENRFQSGSRLIFRVGKDFPRITAGSFKVPLPRQILGVKYSVNLEGVTPQPEAELFKPLIRGH